LKFVTLHETIGLYIWNDAKLLISSHWCGSAVNCWNCGLNYRLVWWKLD